LSDASASLWNLTAAQVRDQVASVDPTPGGGSVSIVTATLGLASIHKGIAVSLKRSAGDSSRHERLLDLSFKVSALMVSLSDLADSDSLVFQEFLEACALPRGTNEEKTARKMKMEAGLVQATQVPLTAAAEMGRGLDFVPAAARLVDPHVRSEVLAGEVLLRASMKSVLLNVDANLSGISDAAVRDSLKLRRDELEPAAR
jgi:formiminotetrahydrofolate cyclodeaminase